MLCRRRCSLSSPVTAETAEGGAQSELVHVRKFFTHDQMSVFSSACATEVVLSTTPYPGAVDVNTGKSCQYFQVNF